MKRNETHGNAVKRDETRGNAVKLNETGVSAMSMEWFRWWHGCISDPKFTTVARRSGQPRAVVIAIWATLLEHASEASPRGSVERFCPEDAANLLEVEEECIEKVIGELEKKGLISDGAVTKWHERQPVREDYSTVRVREHRKMKRDETHCNAVKRNETRGNAVKRNETLYTDTDTDADTDPDKSSSTSSGTNYHRGTRKSETSKEDRWLFVKSHECDEKHTNPYPPEFEETWKIYPERSGGNNKQAAYRAWKARIKKGASVEELQAGTERYASYCEATGKVGTEYVKMASTFYGPNHFFLDPWKHPACIQQNISNSSIIGVNPATLSDIGKHNLAAAEEWLRRQAIKDATSQEAH